MNNSKAFSYSLLSNIKADAEEAFWDEFFKKKTPAITIEEFEDGPRLKIIFPIKKIRTN